MRIIETFNKTKLFLLKNVKIRLINISILKYVPPPLGTVNHLHNICKWTAGSRGDDMRQLEEDGYFEANSM